MRPSRVLGTLLLLSVYISSVSAICTNGLAGVQSKTACCLEACGFCGGSGCSARGPGLTGDDCCEGDIIKTGEACATKGEAPCIIGSETFPPPSSTTPAPVFIITPFLPTDAPLPSSSTCSNGFPGVQTSTACCTMGCGTCGGSGCSNRNGLTANDCCAGNIIRSGTFCSVKGEAPCVVGPETPSPIPPSTLSPAPLPTPPESTCSNGFPGVQTGMACCTMGCGTCGGSGCSNRNGLTADDCCAGRVVGDGEFCSVTGQAPCIVGDEQIPPAAPPTPSPVAPPTPTPVVPESPGTCSNGIPGVEAGSACCPLACGTCGGSGCSNRNGLTGSDCCAGQVVGSGELCSVKLEAPCVVGDEQIPPAAPPTPSPVAPPTPTPVVPESPGTCSNGIPGIEAGSACCPLACGTCGGSGCSNRNGLTGSDCCVGQVVGSGELCSVKLEAPCVVGDEQIPPAAPPTPSPVAPPTPAPVVPESPGTCSNGIPGVEAGSACCPLACGTCGGSGCSNRNGLTGSDCCAGQVVGSGELCSVKLEAPCVVDGGPIPPISPPSIPPTFPATQPTPSPTPVVTISSSCIGATSAIRYSSSSGVNGRMYMEDGGCATMTDLYQSRVESDGWTSKGPIYVLDANNDIVTTPTAFTGKWLLASELHILRGSIFYCRGRDIGGDCDELRIQSTGPTDFHEVRGHGGSLYFENTIVTSWDTPNKKPQEIHEGGRSFINCVSEVESSENCVGQPKNDYGECRMDILNSEMGYMGYFDSESYGLTWKVRGFCADKTNPEVFDNVDVYGDIKNSDIHHMYYGMYSYGHQGGVWINNEMHDNHQYGFDPHDDSDYLTIANNNVYNNVNHGIIASKRCNHVNIYNNEVYDGGAQAAGIFLHRSTDSARVYDNYVHDMMDAGIAMLESFDAEIYDNVFENVKYGIRISLGGSNNYVHGNTFDTCSDYGLYTYKGSDSPEVYDDGRPGENYFYDNKILNTATGVKFKRADNIEIIGNTFTGTDLLEFNHAFGTIWSNNVTPSGTCYKNIREDDDGVDIPPSTFAGTSTLPDLC